ncbi:phage replisome organizer region-containing protein (plasmid) [Clostridium botulinum C/D str. BKT12695]|nr:phage replisome organizer region-containing protein [Clostridium botulinum C/D str. BKT12695]
MAEIKWIKITTNMFDDEKIKLIDAMPERDTIHYVWIRLLVQAGKTNANGYIFLNENVPYTDEMLSTIFNRPLNSIRLALKTLSDFGMINADKDNLIKISNWEKHQNIEGMEKIREQTRKRVAMHRAKKKEEEKQKSCPQKVTSRDSNVTVTQQNKRERENKKEERDKDIDIEREKEREDVSHSQANKLFNYAEKITSIPGILNLAALKLAIKKHGYEHVQKAIDKSVAVGKVDMAYINGILKNWKKEGYPEEKQNAVGSNKVDSFNNYEQRNYDFDELEKKLLGWQDEESEEQT